MKQAILYKKLAGNKVQCGVCNHRCFINNGKKGICGVRENKKGILHSLVYGKAVAENIDPVEKKPLYHFLPGTRTLSIATVGCNFKCLHCQNADISQFTEQFGKNLLPEKVIEHALENNCPSISYTYTEPTIFVEYALDTMKLAQERDLKNIWVSNGYMTKETIDLISPYLDAINVDLKAFTEKFYQEICGAKLKPVLDNLKYIKENGIWLEVTTLIIPNKNDSPKELKDIAEFIKKELGSETPWHVSRFFPTHKLTKALPTKPEIVYNAKKVGKKVGLKYVYTGNI